MLHMELIVVRLRSSLRALSHANSLLAGFHYLINKRLQLWVKTFSGRSHYLTKSLFWYFSHDHKRLNSGRQVYDRRLLTLWNYKFYAPSLICLLVLDLLIYSSTSKLSVEQYLEDRLPIYTYWTDLYLEDLVAVEW